MDLPQDNRGSEASPDTSVIAGTALDKRLRSRAFNLQEAKGAIQGQRLPASLGRLATRHAVVRGIRYHASFASGPAAVLRGVLPLFTRALNARAIMSNEIPDIAAEEEFPYCIWHPDLPSQETLQALTKRYPQMLYQVGRTCVIAGYNALYRSLDLLPEVARAEEARESGNQDIYQDILKAPTKWQVFDDFSGSLYQPRPARLNGDTCIRTWLDLKQPVLPPVGLVPGEEDGDPAPGDDADPDEHLFSDALDYEIFGFPGYRQPHYNVTEDMQLDTKSSRSRLSFRSPDWDPMSHFSDTYGPDGPKQPLPELPDVVRRLVHEPLPEDLPTCDKDWLIRMAAYTGNIDRYARLRRPWFVEDELRCVERGIYHSALFARWWASQINNETDQIIKCAINARYIMSDDLSRFLGKDPVDDYPYHIWFPDIARVETYRALAIHFPAMRPQVARAAIYADYQELFDLLMNGSTPDTVASAIPPEDGNGAVDPRTVYTHYGSLFDDFMGRRGPDTYAAPSHDSVTSGPGAPTVAMEPTKPDHYLYLEAHFSRNPHYKTVLLKKAAEYDIDITTAESVPDLARRRRLECVRETHKIRPPLTPDFLGIVSGRATFTCDAQPLELYVLMPKEWRPKPEEVSRLDDGKHYLLCYDNWPRSVWAIVDGSV